MLNSSQRVHAATNILYTSILKLIYLKSKFVYLKLITEILFQIRAKLAD